MGKIDDLYKRAFGHSSFTYSDDSWAKMDGLLNEKMPVGSAYSTVFLKTISGIAASAVIAGAAYFGSTSTEKVKSDENTNRVAQIIDSESSFAVNENRESQSIENSANIESFENFELKEIRGKKESRFIVKTSKNKLIPTSSLKHDKKLDNNYQAPTTLDAKRVLAENQKPATNFTRNEKLGFSEFFQNNITSSKSLVGRSSKIVKIKKVGVYSKVPSLALLDVNLNPNIKLDRRWKSVKTVSAYGGFVSITDDNKLSVSGVDEAGKSELNNTNNQTYSAGLNVQVAFKNWYGSMGLGITQRSSAYNFEETTTKLWNEENIITNVEFVGFDSVILGQEIRIVERDGVEYMEIVSTKYGIDTAYKTVYDTINLTHSTTENSQKSFGYKANYLSIPLAIGFEQQINKFSIGLGVGIQMNVLSSISGQVYDGTDQQFKAKFKDRLNPVVYATSIQANIGYDVQPGLSLILQPRVVKSLNSTFKQSDELASNYTGFGTTVALRYKF